MSLAHTELPPIATLDAEYSKNKPEVKENQRLVDNTPPNMPSATPQELPDIPAVPLPTEAPPLITAEQYAKSVVGGRYHEPSPEPISTPSEPPTAVPQTVPSERPTRTQQEQAPQVPQEVQESQESEQLPAQESKPLLQNWRIVGQVFNSYIIVEREDDMLLIDQHAAHERLLYEQLRARMHEVEPTSQPLILPLEVMMMSDEVAALCEYQKELEAIGFSFTAHRNTLELTALPSGVDRDVASDMLCTIAERIRNNTGAARLTRDIIFERALYQGACKAAIKAGRAYQPEHLQWVVEQLMQLPDITVCPHGRPVAMRMSKKNIDHQFERS